MKTPHMLSKNTAALMRIRCTLAAAAAAFFIGGAAVFSKPLGLFLGGAAAVCYLFVLFYYIPRFVKSACYELNAGQLLLCRGVFFQKRTALHLAHVQYLRLKAGPVQRLYHCMSLSFEVAGARLLLFDLDEADALALKAAAQEEDTYAL